MDGRQTEQDALICSVANGRYIGGGIPICPEANPDDGKLDVVLIDHASKWKIVRCLPALLMGRVLKLDVTHHIRCEQVEISSPGMHLNVDGEVFLMDKAAFGIHPGRLKLIW
ncbi:MAG: hypothetical protein Q4C54_10575 [Clostridia bacterium]|nr:hypothetical protein [Clostridia bacterium]